MKNNFANEYAGYEELKKAYDAAENEKGKETARAGYKEWEASIAAKGEDYLRTFRFYKDARERGNEYIDIGECHEYRNEQKLIENFREFGIEAFTFSSGWSSAVDSAWIFIQSGCTLEGMLEINGQHRDYFNGGAYEKTHGYLFKVN